MSASVRPGFVLLRIALAVVFISIAAVLVVEGVLILQLGQGRAHYVGRVTGIERGEATSKLSFFYVTYGGYDRENSCEVPTEFADELIPGRTLEIYERRGLRRDYACVKEGFAALRPEGTRSIYWGLAAGVLSFLMIALLLYDLWRYSRALEPGTSRRRARFSRQHADSDE